MKKYLVLTLILMLSLTLIVGCGNSGSNEGGESGEASKKVELAYVEWATEITSNNVVKVVLEEKLGYDVELTSVGAAAMFQAVAMGDVDGIVAAWLPTTHNSYVDKIKDDVEDLGVNLDGTRIGLVVPKYVDIDSIEELKANADKFDGKIIGIEPGAGIMDKTEIAIEEYGLDNFELGEGTGATMTAALADALKNEEWVVVTGWSPHWKFARWDLKYLEDPKNIYGGEEQIHTIVRKGLKEDMPEVYTFLDKFNWTPEDMEKVMIWNEEEGADPYENAKRWVAENEDKVNAWLE
ncbi:glycine betaine/proline transport system substrate-binding protein [Desulfonispora thiosulfatigenes DSM 11270]|uniref:Glycine betaine/proline transport system substrate-binding protein n=1 Tax=Desulfonispora thiosulfatigenes DSM 11270 TaxID=656914 RepID=A0A1W1V2P0_DESTI|nr:glycine betaine ABC transporter substrate-binding protein [Desulfonispora thiosulfatigenes]SMB87647.1 glycine betaine/proline transport system substrate-binding protein [Desulfonispora thiosulfatigenes DSM 11270]